MNVIRKQVMPTETLQSTQHCKPPSSSYDINLTTLIATIIKSTPYNSQLIY